MFPIHPKIVHFPVALLISAYILFIVASIWNINKLKIVAHWNLILGAFTAIPAMIVGCLDSEMLTLNQSTKALLKSHENIGLLATILFLLITIWKIFRGKKFTLTERYVFFLFFTLGIVGLAYTSHMGGDLVYKHIVINNK